MSNLRVSVNDYEGDLERDLERDTSKSPPQLERETSKIYSEEGF